MNEIKDLYKKMRNETCLLFDKKIEQILKLKQEKLAEIDTNEMESVESAQDLASNIVNHQLDFNRFKEINLNEYFTCEDKVDFFWSNFLSNGDFIVAYSSFNDFDLIIEVINTKTKLVKKKLIQNVFFNDIKSYGTKVVLYYFSDANHTGFKHYISILNDDLEFENQVDVSIQALIGLNDTHIFCTSFESYHKPLVLYDWNLRFVDSIGQRINPKEPFYFSLYMESFNAKNNFYYFMIKNVFKIVDSITGKELNSIRNVIKYNLCADQKVFLLKENLSLFCLNNNNNNNLLKEIHLFNFNIINIKLISFDNKDKLYVFDKENYILYIQ
jgi:hypothetical protein